MKTIALEFAQYQKTGKNPPLGGTLSQAKGAAKWVADAIKADKEAKAYFIGVNCKFGC